VHVQQSALRIRISTSAHWFTQFNKNCEVCWVTSLLCTVLVSPFDQNGVAVTP